MNRVTQDSIEHHLPSDSVDYNSVVIQAQESSIDPTLGPSSHASLGLKLDKVTNYKPKKSDKHNVQDVLDYNTKLYI